MTVYDDDAADVSLLLLPPLLLLSPLALAASTVEEMEGEAGESASGRCKFSRTRVLAFVAIRAAARCAYFERYCVATVVVR